MKQDTTKDAKPGGIRKLMLSSHTATSTASDQHAINPLPTAGEKTQVSKTKEPQHVLPLQRPPLSASSSSSSSSTKPAINDNNDSGQSQKSKVEVGMSGEVEQSTVMVSMSGTTQEKSAIVERSSANFTSSQLDDSAVNSDNVKDELREEQIEETQNTSSETLMDEQVCVHIHMWHTHTQTHMHTYAMFRHRWKLVVHDGVLSLNYHLLH